MTTDSALRSRRAMLGAGLGALAATVAGALGRPSRASADTGGAVILGMPNTADTHTSIANTGGLSGVTLAISHTGAMGESGTQGGIGLHGYVTGTNGVAVRGTTSGHWSQYAVKGVADTEGIGVHGMSTNGIGVLAEGVGGYGLQVKGRAVFERSGKVNFAAGQSSRKVTGYGIEPDSLIVATIQGNVAGTYVRGVSLNATENTFTIRLNQAAPAALTVGFLIVN